MHGRRFLNLELTSLDPDLERNIRRVCRARGEMGENQRNPRVEEHLQNPRNENMEEHEEFQDARGGNGEHRRAYELDFTTSIWELFAPTAVSSHLCIVLPPTNATYYDLKPHVIQMLPCFYGLDHENPYSHVKKFRSILPQPNSKISPRNLSILDFFLSPFMTKPLSGWIPWHLALLHPGKNC
jgi:hypothetical protein